MSRARISRDNTGMMDADLDVPGVETEDFRSSATSQVGHHHRDAIRLLFILVMGSEPTDAAPTGHARNPMFRGEKRAMAMDFLVRYPDYLADQLLDRYEAERDPALLRTVERIFAAAEPDVRSVAMVRWRRGAFQNIEQPLSILRAYDLVRPLRQSAGLRRHDFEILPAARPFMDRVLREQPALRWYRDRVGLVLTLARLRSGSSLKDDQYLQPEYRDAPHGTEIPSIKDRVFARLMRLNAER